MEDDVPTRLRTTAHRLSEGRLQDVFVEDIDLLMDAANLIDRLRHRLLEYRRPDTPPGPAL